MRHPLNFNKSTDENHLSDRVVPTSCEGAFGTRASAVARAARSFLSNLIDPRPRMSEAEAQEILRDNFFGAAAWRIAFHPEPGCLASVPPIPATVTRELLDSLCPIHPGLLVKESHILVLVPNKVDGCDLTPLRLADLCRGARVLDRLQSDERWERMPFASLNLSSSRWVLMPKDLDSSAISNAKRFFGKDVDAQNAELGTHFPQYREVTVLELFTAAALYCAINGKALFGMDYLRCNDESPMRGRICLGRFSQPGFLITTDDKANRDFKNVGRAIAYKI